MNIAVTTISQVLPKLEEQHKTFYYGSKADIKAVDTADIVTAPAKKTITEPKPPSFTVTATVPESEVVEQPKPQIPPRPVMPPEATAFPRLHKVKATLDKHNNLIFEAERERNKLELELSDLKGRDDRPYHKISVKLNFSNADDLFCPSQTFHNTFTIYILLTQKRYRDSKE